MTFHICTECLPEFRERVAKDRTPFQLQITGVTVGDEGQCEMCERHDCACSAVQVDPVQAAIAMERAA